MQSPRLPGRAGLTRNQTTASIPVVGCQPLTASCDTVNSGSGGAVGVNGLNAVDSGTAYGEDVEPPDQGLCAGNGYVVETNNIGEILIFDTNLNRVSSVIPYDTLMGLTTRGWSSGGDPSCYYDYANGGHFIFTEIVSANSESSGGTFTGCFAAVPHDCYEGIAVTQGKSPFGPYNVYFLNANYNPAEPGYPSLLNDFAKIATTRDAFELFYDEFPLNPSNTGVGGGDFNGAQEFAFNKNALEKGLKTTLSNGQPNPAFTVARENMGTLPTPAGTCASDNTYHQPGIACWYAVIPAQAPDPTQFDNSNGGMGYMMGTLDYYGLGGNQIATWAWTGLSDLNSLNCSECSGIKFSGELFSNVAPFYNPTTGSSSVPSYLAPQKVGPIPLGNECGAAGLSSDASCPEGPVQTNGDFMTQVSQANGQLWAATTTEVDETFSNPSDPMETHGGAVYWVVGTNSKPLTLTGEGYAAAAHEELEFPAIGAEGTSSTDGGDGLAIMDFTLSGNGGPFGFDNGGFYPSTAYGRLSSTSDGLFGSVINVADLGQSPTDGFTEYQGYPGTTRPRWGDYSWAIFLPNSGGRDYFATNYIQYPNCEPPEFTLTIGTCGGTRDGFANWGTSVNYVVP